MQNNLSRRHFLKMTGVLGLSLNQLQFITAVAGEKSAGSPLRARPDYSGWEDIYRQAWNWDKVIKGTHPR
ncbi:MAG: twin-arginine translocation signal domain-containing protein [Gammaproteobacteria bacterium]|nr:twin-arginine translocation signal domain-containing protein [Gammaproteobacteria bacterium]